MKNTKVTVASLKSVLIDPQQNIDHVREACAIAERDNARMLFLPELMLTGHGAHPKMAKNAEPVPEGPLSSAIVELSKKHNLCICVGIAELKSGIVYNSQFVVDRGEYLGLQRKINLSGDEYCHFGAGDTIESFDIGDIRFGIIICYDNYFPELALIHSLNDVDLILAPHAARTGDWPDPKPDGFDEEKVKEQQQSWAKIHRARAFDHNVFVLLNDVVGPSTEGLENVVANHTGTVMGFEPGGNLFLESKRTELVDEIVTVELNKEKLSYNHAPKRNRQLAKVIRMLEETRDGN